MFAALSCFFRILVLGVVWMAVQESLSPKGYFYFILQRLETNVEINIYVENFQSTR